MSISEMFRSIDLLTKKECGAGATDREIAEAEHTLDVHFPKSYRAFLSRFGWAQIYYDTLYGLGPDVPRGYALVRNALSERYEAHPLIPHHLVPIMNDGAGNNYCLNTSNLHGGECPVVFWDHEHEDGPNQAPQQVSPSFDQWLIDRIVSSSHAGDD
jgi:cell wall assembly regulator SMI1